MELRVEKWSIDDLIEYAGNPRKNDHVVDQMAAAIEEFGFRVPVVATSDGQLIDGHLRLKAARKLGLAEVPVAIADDLTPTQMKAFRLSVNKIAELAEWDEDLLKIELSDLTASGFAVELIGFDAKEMDKLLHFAGNDGEGDPDAVPEAPADPVSRVGDIWQLGDHRIICGDSTDADTVAALLAGEKPHLMVTDPPYGVEYDPSWRAKAGVNKNTKKLGKVLNDDRADWRDAWALFPGDVAYVWHASLFTREVLNSLEACDSRHRSMIIWVKDRFTLGRGDYHWQHEPCWYVVRDGKKGSYVGGRSQSTTWEIPARDDSGVGHGTQKPVECMKRPIENNSQPGDAIYEPFSGSGTTIIAAEITGRRAFAIELNPAYVDVAVRRWEAFTGEQAVLAADGRAFADVEAERCKAEA